MSSFCNFALSFNQVIVYYCDEQSFLATKVTHNGNGATSRINAGTVNPTTGTIGGTGAPISEAIGRAASSDANVGGQISIS